MPAWMTPLLRDDVTEPTALEASRTRTSRPARASERAGSCAARPAASGPRRPRGRAGDRDGQAARGAHLLLDERRLDARRPEARRLLGNATDDDADDDDVWDDAQARRRLPEVQETYSITLPRLSGARVTNHREGHNLVAAVAKVGGKRTVRK